MSATRSSARTVLLRILVNHNPFYVISAGLVLLGLHKSFSGSLDPASGGMMVAMYCGYMALLAVVAYAVIRFGQVWEDARTILLIIVLLMFALSNSLDGLMFNNARLGQFYLGVGFLFAIVISECVLVVLRMRLPARYRIPFYLQLGLLFAYPALLSSLLMDEQKTAMRACVLLFPLLAGLTVMCLVPAARGKPSRESANGTPWRWPLYPWPLFVITTVGLALRSYSLSLSFEVGDGLETGFDTYFLFPILLAAAVVLIELAIAGGAQKMRRWLILLPLCLLPLALPGQPINELQLRFLDMLREAGGIPIQLALVATGLFYLIHVVRATPRAELGLCVCLGAGAVVDARTLDFTTLAFPQATGVLLLALYLLATGFTRQRSALAIAGGVLALTVPVLKSAYALNWDYGLFALSALVTLLASIGMTIPDRLGVALRRRLPAGLAIVALLAAVTWPYLLTRVTPVQQVASLLNFSALAALYWLRHKLADDLVATAATVASLPLALSLHLVIELQQRQLLKGIQFLAWGLLFLLVALVVSLIKGGLVARLETMLNAINQTANGQHERDKAKG